MGVLRILDKPITKSAGETARIGKALPEEVTLAWFVVPGCSGKNAVNKADESLTVNPTPETRDLVGSPGQSLQRTVVSIDGKLQDAYLLPVIPMWSISTSMGRE